MNITTIKKTGITTLTIKKEAQAHAGAQHEFLANQSAQTSWNTYSKTNDPTRILPVGTTLTVLGIYPADTKYGPAHIEVRSSTGRTFDIMAPDIAKFTS
jgi:hypothetical protein